MAQSYNRQINLYINIDGKEVVNNAASIRAEMTKIINTQARMTIGSQEYVASAQKIKQLKGILEQHRADLASVDKSWSFAKMGDSFNRYTSMVMAGVATLTGLVFSVKTVIKSFEDFEARMANLSAITGLTGDDLTWLGEKAKELSTTTLEGGIRITKSATDIVDAFEKMGSARPDLLKNKEDLVEVTKAALVLAEGSKLETLPAIEAVAAAMNQFSLGASQATRIINVMGAGSLAGSSEVDNLTQSLSTCGTVAANSNLTLEQTVGALETLAERQLKGEEAGTQFKTTLISLKAAGLGYTSGIFNMRDAIVELKAKLDDKKTAMEKDNELISVFGKRNITVGTILTTSIERYDHFTKAVTGTNVAFEQAAVNTDTHAAKLAQASNRLNIMSIELGEKLAPALSVSTSGLSYFIKAMSVTIDFIARNKAMIGTLIVSLSAYWVTTQLVTLWEARLNKEKLINIVLGKLQALGYTAQFAAISLYNAGIALLSGNLAVASVQWRAFSAAMAANPIGLIVGLIVAAGTALYFYSGQMNAAQKAQEMMNDVNLEAQKNIVEEKIKLGSLLDMAKNEKLSKEARINALNQLIALSPKYLSGLTLETINTKGATDAVKAYTDSLFEKAKAQAAQEKLVEIEKELLDLASGKGADVSFWQGAGNAMLSFGNASVLAGRNAGTAISNLTERQAELNLQKKKLLEVTKKQAEEELKSQGSGGGDKAAKDLIKLKEEELKNINEEIAATPAEIASRNQRAEALQNEINKLKELGTTKQGESGDKADEALIKKRIASAEAAHSDEMARIKREHLEGKSSDDQYKADLLTEDLKFFAKKMTIYKEGSKEYEVAYNESLTKQVEAQKIVHELLLKAQKELADAGIANMEDGIAKEKALEENRWTDELDGLWKQLNTKKELNAEEEALNDTINKIILAKYGIHLKKMADLNKADDLRKRKNIAEGFNSVAQNDTTLPFLSLDTLTAYFKNRKTLLDEQYAYELETAGKNHNEILAAEERYHARVNQLNKNEAQAVYAMTSRKMEIGQQYISALETIFGKESALGKALFLFSQALAIADVWVKTAASNAAIYSEALVEFAWMGPGAPAAAAAFAAAPLAANNTNAALQTGLIVAQTVASFIKGHATGGFTNGDHIYRAGEEGEEWIAPNWMLQNPVSANIIAGLEASRKTKYLPTSGAVAASSGGGLGNRGNNDIKGVKVSNEVNGGSGGISEGTLNRIAMALENNEKVMNKIEKWDPAISIETYERKKKNWEKVTGGGLK